MTPMRLSGIFIALCMLIIAGSVGAVVYLYLELGLFQAALAAGATLGILILYNLVSGRIGFRAVIDRQLTDLGRASADMARQMAEMGRRLAALEGKAETTLEQARAITDPFAAEISELGTLIKSLAEALAAQQAGLDALQRSAASVGDTLASPTGARAPAEAPSSLPLPGEAQEPRSRSIDSVVAAVRSSIEENAIELYLQPIVTLPQRKVRFYESTTRLRDEKGEPLHAAEFASHAESAGLMPRVDDLVLFRCVAIVRRLLLKNHEIGLFCNLSGTTLADQSVFSKVREFLIANRVVAPSLVLQFTHAAVRTMGSLEFENLASLVNHGFRFSVDQMLDLRIEPADLAGRGFRFAKIHSNLLLRNTRFVGKSRPAEFSELLGRSGIDLVADEIDNENAVVDLLDLDVRYGQGALFSPARPVRPEALQPLPEQPPLPGEPKMAQGPAHEPAQMVARMGPEGASYGDAAAADFQDARA